MTDLERANAIQDINLNGGGYWSTAAYWDGNVYLIGVSGPITQWTLNNGRLPTAPTHSGSTSYSYPVPRLPFQPTELPTPSSGPSKLWARCRGEQRRCSTPTTQQMWLLNSTTATKPALAMFPVRLSSSLCPPSPTARYTSVLRLTLTFTACSESHLNATLDHFGLAGEDRE